MKKLFCLHSVCIRTDGKADNPALLSAYDAAKILRKLIEEKRNNKAYPRLIAYRRSLSVLRTKEQVRRYKHTQRTEAPTSNEQHKIIYFRNCNPYVNQFLISQKEQPQILRLLLKIIEKKMTDKSLYRIRFLFQPRS